MTNKEKLKTPQNDFLFKKIFAKKENQGMLKELLEGILEISIKNIRAIQEVVMDKTTEEDKESRIDIQAEINEDTIINIEMQIRNEGNLVERSLFSGAALYHNSLKIGQNYKENKLSVVICILSFNLFESKKFIVSSRMRRDDNYEELTNGIRLYYIQLPKFIEQKDERKKKLAEWLYFISQEDKEGLKMAVKDNKKVADAQEQLLELLQDEDVKLKIFAREKAEFDRQTAMYHARKEGMEKGLKKARKEDAKKMLEKGISIDMVSEITGLSKEELEKLMK